MPWQPSLLRQLFSGLHQLRLRAAFLPGATCAHRQRWLMRLSRVLGAVGRSGGVRRQHPWLTAADGLAGLHCRPLPQDAPLQRCRWWHAVHCTHVRFSNSEIPLPFAGTPHRAATTVRLGPWPHPLRSSESRYAWGSDHGLLASDAWYIVGAGHRSQGTDLAHLRCAGTCSTGQCHVVVYMATAGCASLRQLAL